MQTQCSISNKRNTCRAASFLYCIAKLLIRPAYRIIILNVDIILELNDANLIETWCSSELGRKKRLTGYKRFVLKGFLSGC